MKRLDLIAWGIFWCVFSCFAGYVGMMIFDRIFKVTDFLMRTMA